MAFLTKATRVIVTRPSRRRDEAGRQVRIPRSISRSALRAYEAWCARLSREGLALAEQETSKEQWLREYVEAEERGDLRDDGKVYCVPPPGASCALAWNIAIAVDEQNQ